MHWLLGGYMFLFIHRPFEIWPILGTLQIERVYMLLTLLVWFFQPRKHWFSNRLLWAFLGLLAAVFLCWAVSPFLETGSDAVEWVPLEEGSGPPTASSSRSSGR